MRKGMNALDWYHEKYCSNCDVPGEKCPPGSAKELNCILAALLFETVTQAEEGDVHE